jgi:hypothetical protein
MFFKRARGSLMFVTRASKMKHVLHEMYGTAHIMTLGVEWGQNRQKVSRCGKGTNFSYRHPPHVLF